MDPTAPGPTAPAPERAATSPADDVDLEGIAIELAAVESALERLDAGGYGTCASCGDPIADEVLTADPTALTCAAHLRL